MTVQSLFLLLFLESIALGNDLQTKLTNTATLTASHRDRSTSDDWSWTRDKWTGNNQPFAEVRTQIDQLAKSADQLSAYAKQQESIAKDHPHNALCQYAWGYAAFKLAQLPHKMGDVLTDRYRAFDALAHADQPHTYDYTRLRLLLKSGAPQERALAERLLRKEPNDIDVKEAYVNILFGSNSDSDLQKAIKITEDIVRSGADRPTVYQALGMLYMLQALRHPSHEVELKSIDEYNKFLANTPNFDHRTIDVRRWINMMQSMLKKQ